MSKLFSAGIVESTSSFTACNNAMISVFLNLSAMSCKLLVMDVSLVSAPSMLGDTSLCSDTESLIRREEDGANRLVEAPIISARKVSLALMLL